MGYKVLGYVVWHGGKWYARRRLPGAAPKLALAGLAGVALAGGVIVGGVAVARAARSSD